MTLVINSGQPSSMERGEPGPEIIPASTLPGDTVVSAEGEKIGKIIDVMLDVQAGRIAYAVLAQEANTDAGDDKLLVVPWNSLTLDEEEHDFILDADPSHGDTIPGSEKIIELYKRSGLRQPS